MRRLYVLGTGHAMVTRPSSSRAEELLYSRVTMA